MRNLGKNLAKVIKDGRLAHKRRYSQEQLAAKLGISGQAVSNVERGLASLNIRHSIALSQILEIPLETFKKAVVKDYEDAIEIEIQNLLSSHAGVELRETERRRPDMSDAPLYENLIPSGGYENVPLRSYIRRLDSSPM